MLETETLIVAAGVPLASIRTERFYQFSFVPDPQIFLTIVLPLAGTIATGAVGSALWDAVKSLFRTRRTPPRSEEHTYELQSLMRISYAVICLKKKKSHNI